MIGPSKQTIDTRMNTELRSGKRIFLIHFSTSDEVKSFNILHRISIYLEGGCMLVEANGR